MSTHTFTTAKGTRISVDTRYTHTVNYTRRTADGLRCMPVTRNADAVGAMRYARYLEVDPKNSRITVSPESF